MAHTLLEAPAVAEAAVDYARLTARNHGFVSADLQARMRQTRLLIAGCGLGSVIAEVAVRSGFTEFLLVDGERIESHNLNRQMYRARDVQQRKVDALAHRLREINPAIHVRPVPHAPHMLVYDPMRTCGPSSPLKNDTAGLFS